MSSSACFGGQSCLEPLISGSNHIWIKLKANVYIDGFNLYYAIKFSPYKWLDLSSLCRNLLPEHTINLIRYFTAHIKPLPHDLDVKTRQDFYLRALKTLKDLKLHDNGEFVSWDKLMPQSPLAYVKGKSSSPNKVNVLKTEEKGSDVNLASWLLTDCFNGCFDYAVVISNDSDLATPIEIVTQQCKKQVKVINPDKLIYASKKLARVATSNFRTIHPWVYSKSQFPITLTDAMGTFNKPSSW
jgi:hypothetical protein